jgi:hypothetical protein
MRGSGSASVKIISKKKCALTMLFIRKQSMCRLMPAVVELASSFSLWCMCLSVCLSVYELFCFISLPCGSLLIVSLEENLCDENYLVPFLWRVLFLLHLLHSF